MVSSLTDTAAATADDDDGDDKESDKDDCRTEDKFWSKCSTVVQFW